MKKSRFILWVAVAFILGYGSHVAVLAIRLEQRRAAYERFYQREFPVGEDFEKVAKPWREKGLVLRFYAEGNQFDANLQSDRSDRLQLLIDVDEKQRIKKVIVIHPVRI